MNKYILILIILVMMACKTEMEYNNEIHLDCPVEECVLVMPTGTPVNVVE